VSLTSCRKPSSQDRSGSIVLRHRAGKTKRGTEMRLAAIVALVLSMPAAATTADDDTDAPPMYHTAGQTIVTRHRTTPLVLKDHPKITWLDHEFLLLCVAAQCLATSEAHIVESSGRIQELCTYVDGNPMKPGCSVVLDNVSLQSKRLASGTHSFRTGVVNGASSGGTVCPCEIIYHLYDSGEQP